MPETWTKRSQADVWDAMMRRRNGVDWGGVCEGIQGEGS